ncbi:MAG TPA: hypothetical protein VEY30_00815 [Myxococcaceae bacterium]|nr:hypothetical protein [Myxococcaceae bacterium]
MSLRHHPLLRRLPLLVVAGVGVWLLRSGPGARPRELVWRLPRDAQALRSVDIQILDPAGALLKREVFSFQQPPAVDLRQTVNLPEGRYTARVFVEAGPGESRTRHAERPLELRGDVTPTVLDLPTASR